MKPAMDYDIGEIFEWKGDLYKVVRLAQTSVETVGVVRALSKTQWSEQFENFNPLCEVKPYENPDDPVAERSSN